jgi:parvulin-like peptidyl-prolyl isomerase
VPQAEAEAYFRAHPDRFPKIPSQVRVQVIEIAPQPDSAAMAGGLARIEAIRKRLIGGEKFAKVAADASEDPRSAAAGGDIGVVELNHPVKDFQAFNDAALTLKLNEISAPVRTPYGWHLIQVIERDTLKTVAGRDSLDDAGKPIPEAHVRHILVALKTTDADTQRAAALAARVRDEARKGTDFAALVRRYSSYAGPSGPDGDLGFIPSTQLPPDMRAGLDTLEANQVSEVFTSSASFTLFKLLDRKPERDYTLDDFHGKLTDFVGDLQREDRFDAWMKTLRAKAQIEYH